MTVETFDVSTAYLHADYVKGKKLYMEVDKEVASLLHEADPDLDVKKDNDGTAYFNVQRAVYGSIEGAHLWYVELTKTLTSAGYIQNDYDYCC